MSGNGNRDAIHNHGIPEHRDGVVSSPNKFRCRGGAKVRRTPVCGPHSSPPHVPEYIANERNKCWDIFKCCIFFALAIFLLAQCSSYIQLVSTWINSALVYLAGIAGQVRNANSTTATANIANSDSIPIQRPVQTKPNSPINPDIMAKVCRLEQKVNRMSTEIITMEEIITKLNAAMESATLGKIPEQILDQIMDAEVGTAMDRPLTLRTLILTYIDIIDKKKQYSEDQSENEAKIMQMMDEKLETFKEKLVICGPNSKPEEWCIPPNGDADIESLKKALTQFIVDTIQSQTFSTPYSGDVGKIVSMAIAKYDADKTGLPDLALEPGGGEIVTCRRTKYPSTKRSQINFWGIPIWSPPNTARTIIQPGAVPGECWTFEGEGQVVIKLVAPAFITGFTMEHIPKTISPTGNIDSAPQVFQVVGMTDYNDPRTQFVFGNYKYLDNGNPIQYFSVQNLSDTLFPYVELRVKSNHGASVTCVYRFRVHGSFYKAENKFTPISSPDDSYPNPGEESESRYDDPNGNIDPCAGII